ncbi:MAG: hypothetical protein BJG00_004120 [Limnothrix sp. CACIAM 69d]|nr:MAG: hypothetical protein BJG00_004120 [Limnothrix sp. CACIAM 69d]
MDHRNKINTQIAHKVHDFEAPARWLDITFMSVMLRDLETSKASGLMGFQVAQQGLENGPERVCARDRQGRSSLSVA